MSINGAKQLLDTNLSGNTGSVNYKVFKIYYIHNLKKTSKIFEIGLLIFSIAQ